LLVYFGSHVLMSLLSRPSPDGSTQASDIAAAIAVAGNPQATWTIVLVVFWVVLACFLHRDRIYLRP
jgi:heparan-alpha-glucosaminide N-acetyltransferase